MATIRLGWRFRLGAAVTFFGFLLLVLTTGAPADPKWQNALAYASALAVVAGMSMLLLNLAGSAAEGLDRARAAAESALQGFAANREREIRFLLQEVLGAEIGTPRLLDAATARPVARRLVEDFCCPVVAESIGSQGHWPLICNMTMLHEVCREQKSGYEFAAVKRILRWDLLVREKRPQLGSLIRPTVVCASGVLRDEGLLDLARKNEFDLLYPLPSAWDHDGSLRNAADWYSIASLHVGGVNAHPIRYELANPLSLATLLAHPKDLSEADTGALTRDLFPYVLSAWHVRTPAQQVTADTLPEGWFAVKVEERSLYRVCVGSLTRHEEILYRYEIPFWQPTLVDAIHFSLRGETGPWVLDPASIRCAFRLKNPDNAASLSQQELTWHGSRAGLGTPFLSGHGVAFLWRAAIEEDRKG